MRIGLNLTERDQAREREREIESRKERAERERESAYKKEGESTEREGTLGGSLGKVEKE